jgi:hypothetical protein
MNPSSSRPARFSGAFAEQSVAMVHGASAQARP